MRYTILAYEQASVFIYILLNRDLFTKAVAVV